MSEITSQQLVVFGLGSEEYALPIAAVHEIIRFSEPRSVASGVPWIRGVIGLRGKIIVAEVAAVAEESSASTEQVTATTQQTSASAQQIAASAVELSQTAETLERLVARFRLVP